MTLIGSLPHTQAISPLIRAGRLPDVAAPPRRTHEDLPVLPSGNHIGLSVEAYRDLQRPAARDAAAGEDVSAEEAVSDLRRLLHESAPGSLTDAVHTQLLKSFLVENGLAVTSSDAPPAEKESRTEADIAVPPDDDEEEPG